MDDTQLNRLLIPHDKWAESPEILDAMLERVARNAAEEHARLPRRRRGFRIAAAVATLLGIGALATAATVYIAPNFTPDAVIPISYVTDEGNAVECTFSLAVRSWDGTNVTEAKEWIATHDWTGIGQRGYDLGEKNPTNVGEPDVDPELTQEDLDQLTVSSGIGTAVVEEIPFELINGPGIGTSSTSTCTWVRH
ncbi:hypothetical protein M0722_16455 [Microbacterium sp. KSW4-16]|uniref:hypothetical protein n=1 Tax=Microbacterium aurugineum TaxID=2851642 RepID=UPI0020BD80CA|nr:hypothetical protein [Microbacterium aurugineum]MCK8468787.1 hypothetical protein [Microbacterium aurugineum]